MLPCLVTPAVLCTCVLRSGGAPSCHPHTLKKSSFPVKLRSLSSMFQHLLVVLLSAAWRAHGFNIQYSIITLYICFQPILIAAGLSYSFLMGAELDWKPSTKTHETSSPSPRVKPLPWTWTWGMYNKPLKFLLFRSRKTSLTSKAQCSLTLFECVLLQNNLLFRHLCIYPQKNERWICLHVYWCAILYHAIMKKPPLING